MAEQLTVEVDVKNVTDGRKTHRQAHLFGKDINYMYDDHNCLCVTGSFSLSWIRVGVDSILTKF